MELGTLIPMVYVSPSCDLPFLRYMYSQFKYPLFDATMAFRSDNVLEMIESSERELTVLSSIVFRVKDETSCCVFDCSAYASTSGLMFHRPLKAESLHEA